MWIFLKIVALFAFIHSSNAKMTPSKFSKHYVAKILGALLPGLTMLKGMLTAALIAFSYKIGNIKKTKLSKSMVFYILFG